MKRIFALARILFLCCFDFLAVYRLGAGDRTGQGSGIPVLQGTSATPVLGGIYEIDSDLAPLREDRARAIPERTGINDPYTL